MVGPPSTARRGHRPFLPACVVLASALSSAGVMPQNSGRDPTFIAALRADSLMVPIAMFDRSEWWNPWPISDEGDKRVRSLTLPPTLAEIPSEWLPPGTVFPERWRLQLAAGRLADLRALVPARPTGFSIMEFIGVRTDRAPHLDAVGDEIGIALAGPGELGRFTRPSEKESRAVLGPMMPRLHALARDALAKWRTEHSADETIQLSLVDNGAELKVGLVRAVNVFRGRTYYELTGETR